MLEHAKRTQAGYLGGTPTGRTVAVTPGHYAAAFVEWVVADGRGTTCENSHSIAVTAANTTRTVSRAVHVGRCDLQVHPTTSGRSGSHR